MFGACANFSQTNPRVDEYGITVDYLGRRWPINFQQYSEPPDSIPEFIVRAEMKKVTIDSGDVNDQVTMASSFSPLLAVRNKPVSLPEDFQKFLEMVLKENRPYHMDDIPWPFAPAGHAYLLVSKDLSKIISLTRYDNAFVIQHAFFASSPYDEGGVPYEFQSLGAWATWVKSPELARFLDQTFAVVDPKPSPYSKWLYDSPVSLDSEEEDSVP
jgi:hypothetical protein